VFEDTRRKAGQVRRHGRDDPGHQAAVIYLDHNATTPVAAECSTRRAHTWTASSAIHES
jgi:hypothetical protein